VLPAQSEAMYAAPDKIGIENKLKMYAGADHDFYVKGDPANTNAYATDAVKAMAMIRHGSRAGRKPTLPRNSPGRRPAPRAAFRSFRMKRPSRSRWRTTQAART